MYYWYPDLTGINSVSLYCGRYYRDDIIERTAADKIEVCAEAA